MGFPAPSELTKAPVLPDTARHHPASAATVYAPDAPATPDAPPLDGIRSADVLIIGAGITGLSAALHLAQAGTSVCVLDGGDIGWGASGRNGGQVNPGLKLPPSAVIKRFGSSVGSRLVQAAWSAPDLVFDLIKTHQLACDARRGGTVRAAPSTAQIPALLALTAECEALGRSVAWLDAPQICGLSGTTYAAGMIDHCGGQLNPLAYTLELGRVAATYGAALHTHSHVGALRREGGRWRAETATGAVLADHVVFATNGYTDGLWDRLRRSIVPVFSAIVATEPLDATVCETILSEGSVLYEVGHITTYYRVDSHGRLLFGGRSGLADASGPDAFPGLKARAVQMWPMLAGCSFTHGWNGQVAITTDDLPHWHEPMPGVFAALGYNGRGIAMATLMGRELARRIEGAGRDTLLLPPTPISAIPLHAAWKLGASIKLLEGQIRDRFHL